MVNSRHTPMPLLRLTIMVKQGGLQLIQDPVSIDEIDSPITIIIYVDDVILY